MNSNSARLATTILLMVLGMMMIVPRTSAQEEPDPHTLRVYYLRFIAADDAFQVIGTLYNQNMRDDGMQLAVDERLNAIVIKATNEQHDAIQTLIELLDAQGGEQEAVEVRDLAQNVDVEIFWLADIDADSTDSLGSSLSDVPESISTLVADSLASRLSIDNPKLVSQILVQSAIPGEHPGLFEASGVGDRSGKGLILNASGSIVEPNEGRYMVDLQLDVEVGGDVTQVETSIVTKAEHPICLALAQTGALESFFIIKITPSAN